MHDTWRPLQPAMTDKNLTIVAISGSLRRGSYNTALLRVADEVAPDGVDVEIAPISELPFYNSDVEREQGFPDSVQRFRRTLESADGLLFATPEYNYSVTGALKNAIDWASRRPSPIDEKPAAILGAGGRSGTARSQRHLRDILGHNRLRLVSEPQVMVSGPWDKFDEGVLVDDETRERVSELVGALVASMR